MYKGIKKKWSRISEIVKKEFIQVLRDPRMRVVLFVPPIVQTILFGYAINMDIKNIHIAWMDMDNTFISRELKSRFEGSAYFKIIYNINQDREVRELLDHGKVKAVVRIMPGFAKAILRNKKSYVQVLIDGTDSNTASIIASYVYKLVANVARDRLLSHKGGIAIGLIQEGETGKHLSSDSMIFEDTDTSGGQALGNISGVEYIPAESQEGVINIIFTSPQDVQSDSAQLRIDNISNDVQMGIVMPGFDFEERIWFNPELKSRYYFVTGVIVNIIALVTVMLTAMAIVREKEIGTIEQLMVTPIQPLELIMGKTLPFALIGLIDVALITIAAKLVFGVPFRGSLIILFLSSILFLQASLGVGLFISTISHTQQQALMSTFFFTMPSIMLSGFAFPIRNMPRPIQYITYLNPLRYYMEILRSLFLKGTGISILYPQMLGLLILGLTVMALSVLRFHKRLD